MVKNGTFDMFLLKIFNIKYWIFMSKIFLCIISSRKYFKGCQFGTGVVSFSTGDQEIGTMSGQSFTGTFT